MNLRKASAAAMLYMLDTNICIYLMQRHPPEVRARFAALRRGDVVMSIVTLAELLYGVECSAEHSRAVNAESVRRLVDRVPALAFDSAAAAAYGPMRAKAVRDRRRDALDQLIAAHAISVGATLVTNNEADFADFGDLRVENWVGAPQ